MPRAKNLGSILQIFDVGIPGSIMMFLLVEYCSVPFGMKLPKPSHYTNIKSKIWSAVIQPDKCISFDCLIFIQYMKYSSIDFLRALST
jgi:hypothetical protein